MINLCADEAGTAGTAAPDGGVAGALPDAEAVDAVAPPPKQADKGARQPSKGGDYASSTGSASHPASIAATSLGCLIAVGLIGGSRAHAQSAEAEGVFDEGNKLMTEGEIARACDAFEASNRVEPRAGTLIRLGECRELNQQLASAWSAYKDALTRVKDPRKRQVAMARTTALEPRLSYLTVSCPTRSGSKA